MLFSNLLLATVAAAGVVHVPLSLREVSSSDTAAALLKERGVYHDTQVKGALFYEAELEVGTPPQKVKACFDTGSPLLWLPGSNSTKCQQGKCRSSYDVTKSSTWKYLRWTYNWGGIGNWGNETVSYAGNTLENFQVWVSKGSEHTYEYDIGIFGQSGWDDPSANFVQGLADSGKIPRAIYSINAEKPIYWKNKITEGVVNNVYYGGFDRAKYEGPLTEIKVDHHGGYAMPLGGWEINGQTVKTARQHQIVLDTGGIALQLPNSTLGQIATTFGGSGKWEAPGFFEIPCGAKPKITYVFGYTKIEVDLSLYVLPAPQGGCRLEGVTPVPDNQQIMLTGPPLISKALVIYDNTRDTVTVGKAKYTDESDIVELTGDIPGTVKYEDWVAGKPLPESLAVSSSSVASIASSSVAPSTHSSSAASSVAPSTHSTSSTHSSTHSSIHSSAAPVSSTLAVKTTSTEAAPEPTPEPEATESQSIQWCELFGIFC